jgi:DUF4097 and DUF4098 domain-containing protein YvlB
MKTLTRTTALLAVLLAAAGCGRVESRVHSTAEATINRSWPAAGIREVRVFEVDGSISIEATTSSEISLVATARGDFERKAGAENEGLFETTLEGDTLRIGRKKHNDKHFNFKFFFDREDKRINYALRVPATIALNVSTVNGKIATRGVDGETAASTVNGTIDIEMAGTSQLDASTVNGRVRAKFLTGFQGARFKTVNGGVEATLPQTASFQVDLSQVNGDFDASFPLSIHSNPGSRRVSGQINGGEHRLKIVTVNGDVELHRLGDI